MTSLDKRLSDALHRCWNARAVYISDYVGFITQRAGDPIFDRVEDRILDRAWYRVEAELQK